MKKYLAILCILTIALTSCNSKETSDKHDSQAAQKVEQVVEETKAEEAAETDSVDKADAEAQDATEEMAAEEEADMMAEEESEYATFEKDMAELYKGEGITDIMVLPYSKGIDITFHVDNKNMKKDEFTNIAKEVVKELKNNFDFIDKDLPIGCSLEYQPDPNENTEVLMEADIK